MNGDPHAVNCALCERPGSRGGRALAGMIAFRRAQSKMQRLKGFSKRTAEGYADALRQFAERHQNDDL